MLEPTREISDRPGAFQKWIAASWFVLGLAFGMITARAIEAGYATWWAWALVTALCALVGWLHWNAHRVMRWIERRRASG
jgi:hypothetical protein